MRAYFCHSTLLFIWRIVRTIDISRRWHQFSRYGIHKQQVSYYRSEHSDSVIHWIHEFMQLCTFMVSRFHIFGFSDLAITIHCEGSVSLGCICTSPRAQSPPIICHAPTASRREATRSYPTRWRPRLGENGKCWISKFSLNDITQILLHIKDYNIWNSFSLTDMRLLPQK